MILQLPLMILEPTTRQLPCRESLVALLQEDLDFHDADSSYASHNFHYQTLISPEDPIALLTPLREGNEARAPYILHASISCKWTLRSDRGQNARTEALNLIRNRKGHTPHIAAVTAEPLPTRIASLALGTGDLDCVYHFALPELQAAIVETNNIDQMDMLTTLVDGKRLRDISDLPFDLIA